MEACNLDSSGLLEQAFYCLAGDGTLADPVLDSLCFQTKRLYTADWIIKTNLFDESAVSAAG
jgi:hypothetical protein